jgi:hypothetical protein
MVLDAAERHSTAPRRYVLSGRKFFMGQVPGAASWLARAVRYSRNSPRNQKLLTVHRIRSADAAGTGV